MNPMELYTWTREVLRCFASANMGRWQALTLALFSYGVMVAGRCQLQAVADSLALAGLRGRGSSQTESVHKRLKRWLANGRIDLRACQRAWVRWIVQQVDEVVLLVDETKLGLHLSVMMVGLAYHGRCIPLVWRCYQATAYPKEGQVKLIAGLLDIIQQALPPGPPGCRRPLLLADRGLGTSPGLVRAVQQRGWRYLFRVQRSTRLVTRGGRGGRGGRSPAFTFTLGLQPSGWSGHGLAFSRRGRVRAYALVWRGFGQAEAWCLLTNDPALSVHAYALRNWQEQAFRDLKSGGWQWQRSQVHLPDHADRLVLVLALAYARMLTLGCHVAAAAAAALEAPDPDYDALTFAVRTTIPAPSRRYYPGRSLFQLGLAFWRRCLAIASAMVQTCIPFRLLAWSGIPAKLLC